MPRTRPRTTTRGSVSAEVLARASEEVQRGDSVKAVSRAFGVCHMTLRRFLEKKRALEALGATQLPSVGYRSHTQVFSQEQEATLVTYLERAAQLHYGLNGTEIRRLAYELAKTHKLKYHKAWDEAGLAGKDWLTAFLKRHPALSLRTRQQASRRQPALCVSTPQQPALSVRTPQQPALSVRTPQQPALSVRTPQQPALSVSTPQQPALSVRTPQQPALSVRTPQQPALSVRTPQQPALSVRTPQQPALSVRTPQQPALCVSVRTAHQPTSHARAEASNESDVGDFFANLACVLQSYVLTADRIYCMDEITISTVQEPEKGVAGRGVKQAHAVTSATHDHNTVTMALAVSAAGASVPPHFIFPRKKFHPYFLRGGPPGCVGTANAGGRMREDDFLFFLRHFAETARPAPERNVLLLLDNNSSHVSLRSMDYCSQNHMVLLTFPPHDTHRLQPLDTSVFGPFKRFYATRLAEWLKANPGHAATIYDVPGLVTEALPLAATPSNILAGFLCTGVWPLRSGVWPPPTGVWPPPTGPSNAAQQLPAEVTVTVTHALASEAHAQGDDSSPETTSSITQGPTDTTQTRHGREVRKPKRWDR